MNPLRPRPPFVLEIAAPPEAVVDAVRAALRHDGAGFEGAVATRHVVLRVPQRERRFWSPVLDATALPTEHGGTVLRGSFGPHPSVWTMFVFIRACLLVATTATTVFACSQSLVLGSSPWWKWAALAAVLVVVEYVGAQVGQRLGHDQIATIEAFVRQAVEPAPRRDPAG